MNEQTILNLSCAKLSIVTYFSAVIHEFFYTVGPGNCFIFAQSTSEAIFLACCSGCNRSFLPCFKIQSDILIVDILFILNYLSQADISTPDCPISPKAVKFCLLLVTKETKFALHQC